MGNPKVKNVDSTLYTQHLSGKMNHILQSSPVRDEGHEKDSECSKRRKRDAFWTGPGKGNNKAFLEGEMVFGLGLTVRIGFWQEDTERKEILSRRSCMTKSLAGGNNKAGEQRWKQRWCRRLSQERHWMPNEVGVLCRPGKPLEGVEPGTQSNLFWWQCI